MNRISPFLISLAILSSISDGFAQVNMPKVTIQIKNRYFCESQGNCTRLRQFDFGVRACSRCQGEKNTALVATGPGESL